MMCLKRSVCMEGRRRGRICNASEVCASKRDTGGFFYL